MSSPEPGAPQGATQTLAMRPIAIAGAREIDGLKLLDTPAGVTLLYSTQAAVDSGYEMVIHAVPIADATRVTEVTRIRRLLATSPKWDARTAGSDYEFLYERDGGAINDVAFQDIQGEVVRVSGEHPLEDFSRPHFIRQGQIASPDFGAVLDMKELVVFPGGIERGVKYAKLAEGVDGVVGGMTNRWVVTKSQMSGQSLFSVLPGRLTLSRTGAAGARAITAPDLLVYELDAAPLANDVVIFATSKPAVLLLGGQLERPYRLNADDRSSLLQLARPTILVTASSIHVAAIARLRTDQASVLYGEFPIGALAQ